MAFDAFIRIDGISRECNDDQHSDWIELLDYSLGVQQRVSAAAGNAGGASAGRADFTELGFSKRTDLATPQLALACADGTHIDTITIDLCRAGKEKVRFMQYKLSNCLISGFSTAGDDGELPVDYVIVNFGREVMILVRLRQEIQRSMKIGGIIILVDLL